MKGSGVGETELQEIKEKLRVGYCNPIWRKHIEDLVAEVERLRSLIDLVEHAKMFENKTKRSSSNTDTSLM